MPTRNVLLLFLCGLVAVVGLACGSGGGGDDDHAADDDVSDDDVDDDLDDDLTPDDDADDDNDDDVDDDLDDDLDDDADDVSDDDVDDDLDDDADDDTTPDDDSMPDDDVESNALLLMGADASGPASWQQTTEGWVRRDFPPPVTQGFIFDLGPSFFVDGEKGWTTWNVWGDAVTNGHDWLVYDLENGWQYDTGHWRAGAGTVVELLFAADADHLWATSYYDMFGFGSEHLWKYIGPIPVPQLTTLSNPQFTAMFFPNANSGLVSGYIGSAGFLYRYDGPGWTELAMPAGYESGSFDWLWLADVRNGWGVWEAYAGGRHLMALADGVWSEVTPPADCADYRPTQVSARPITPSPSTARGRTIAFSNSAKASGPAATSAANCTAPPSGTRWCCATARRSSPRRPRRAMPRYCFW
jgi:hypothetical protein